MYVTITKFGGGRAIIHKTCASPDPVWTIACPWLRITFMKAQQKRFGAPKYVVMLLVLGLLCFAGWYTWNFFADAARHNDTQQISKANIPADWTTYSNSNLGISFAYPKTWTFTDKTTESLHGQRYIGELTSEDTQTSAGITLTRAQDGQVVYSTIDDWKAHAQKIGIKYSNLTAVKSSYVAFSYVYDAGGATSLVYKILSANKNVELVVLPTDTLSRDVVEQVVETFRFE